MPGATGCCALPVRMPSLLAAAWTPPASSFVVHHSWIFHSHKVQVLTSGLRSRPTDQGSLCRRLCFCQRSLTNQSQAGSRTFAWVTTLHVIACILSAAGFISPERGRPAMKRTDLIDFSLTPGVHSIFLPVATAACGSELRYPLQPYAVTACSSPALTSRSTRRYPLRVTS